MSTTEIVFWERMSSPHVAGLLVALARRGCSVTYAVEQVLSPERIALGWSAPCLGGVRLKILSSTESVDLMVSRSAPDAIHVCDGIRTGGVVAQARRALMAHRRLFWVFMETVDDQGPLGAVKRLEYRRKFWRYRDHLAGVLCAGRDTSTWVHRRGVDSGRAFPFAYFLPSAIESQTAPTKRFGPFRFIFVGQFVRLKRLKMLIEALAAMIDVEDVELVVVGSGPLESVLRSSADRLLPGRVRWLGRLPLEKVPAEMCKSDCLVLPSRHDGWGAVVSEALMVGTPVICSDRCGAAVVVQASGHGGVFHSGDRGSLVAKLRQAIDTGPLSEERRKELANWANSLGAEAGAEYLLQILRHKAGESKPTVPWMRPVEGVTRLRPTAQTK